MGISSAIGAIIGYNLRILPESLICGIIFLAIILVSQPLMILAIGVLFTQLFTHVSGKLLVKYTPGYYEATTISKCDELCAPDFIGKPWWRLLSNTSDVIWNPKSPSVYLATLAYLVGVGMALLLIYKEEINAKVVPNSTLITTGIISGILLLIAIIFRTSNGCETIFAALGGTIIGLLLGYLGTIVLSYATNRRATNIWGIPLIRDRCAAMFTDNSVQK